MISPADLKWADVPSLPPGAKIAVIEGPMSEAVPFTVRIKVPADMPVAAGSTGPWGITYVNPADDPRAK